MTVGMAFTYFAEEKVDIAIIEVGLGGRLDSTNIIVPEVSLITNIGLDHTHILGDTLEKIALEKAGIIKRGVPVVISERQPETETIFTLIAHQLNAPIVFADDMDVLDYGTDVLGDYQKRNMRGVVGAIRHLNSFEVSEKNIEEGLKNIVKNTGLMGRWQILQEKPLMVCDTAHNKEGLQWVIKQISRQKYNKLHLVLGFVNDKDVKGVLSLFSKEATFYFVKPNIPRGMGVEQLREIASEQGVFGNTYGTVKKGLKAAKLNAKPDDLIFVGGSTFVVAEVV
jgi:dihydrofolate synthase/folylpolyglutamate synthase